MSNFDNTNRGQIWRSEKQKPTDRDFQGSINIEGVEYWLSGWARKPEDNPNAPSVRFSVQRKEEVHNQGMQQTNQAMGYSNQQANQQGQAAPQQQQQAPRQKAPMQQAPQQQPAPQQQAPQHPDQMINQWQSQERQAGPDVGDSFDSDIPF